MTDKPQEPQFPCPPEACPAFPTPALGYWAKAHYCETRYDRTECVDAIYFSEISQADARTGAMAEAVRLVQRKFTHIHSPVGSRQLSKYKDRWF